jgi:hypothetical protein
LNCLFLLSVSKRTYPNTQKVHLLLFAMVFLFWSIGAMMGYCWASCRLRSKCEKATVSHDFTVRISGEVWKLPDKRSATHLFSDCGHLQHTASQPVLCKICEDCIKRAKKQA